MRAAKRGSDCRHNGKPRPKTARTGIWQIPPECPVVSVLPDNMGRAVKSQLGPWSDLRGKALERLRADAKNIFGDHALQKMK